MGVTQGATNESNTCSFKLGDGNSRWPADSHSAGVQYPRPKRRIVWRRGIEWQRGIKRQRRGIEWQRGIKRQQRRIEWQRVVRRQQRRRIIFRGEWRIIRRWEHKLGACRQWKQHAVFPVRRAARRYGCSGRMVTPGRRTISMPAKFSSDGGGKRQRCCFCNPHKMAQLPAIRPDE
jgi:hypothetical protein